MLTERELSEDVVARFERSWDIAMSAILEEDIPIGDIIQENAAGPFAGTTLLGKNEINNQHFHRFYAKLMR